MAINRTTSFAGVERRTGFERRTVAPREQATAPRLIGSVTIGDKNYEPGQEAAFAKAVEDYNEQAGKNNQPTVDLAGLEARGAIRNFGGRASSGGESSPATRNEQTNPGSRDPVEVENPGTLSGPGVEPLHVAAPRPPDLSEGSTPTPAGTSRVVGGSQGRSTARRGGAGQTKKGGKGAKGEREAAAKGAGE